MFWKSFALGKYDLDDVHLVNTKVEFLLIVKVTGTVEEGIKCFFEISYRIL